MSPPTLTARGSAGAANDRKAAINYENLKRSEHRVGTLKS